jgi:hypothetical protein
MVRSVLSQSSLACLLSILAVAGTTGCDGDPSSDDGSSEGGGGNTPDDPPVEPACEAPTSGPTVHDEDVTGHEVWTAAGSPHIIDWTVDVVEGGTLEIEPCAVVQVRKGHGLNVAYPGTPTTGTLIAEGTAKRPIRFEGLDGERWGHIFVHAPGTARLAHVTIDGGGGVDLSGASLIARGDGTFPSKRDLFVDNVTISNSLGAGAVVERLAGFAEGSKDLTIMGSGSDEHPYPLEVSEHAIGTIPTGNYTGNRVDEILINPLERLQEDATMRKLGVPYRIGDSPVDHFTIGAGDQGETLTTLTIEPGVTVKMHPSTAFKVEHFTGEFPASGALVAVGTEAEPIVFTSSAPTPAPGDWVGLTFGGIVRPETRLEHVRIEYTGADCGCVLLTCSDIDQFEGAVIMSQPPPSPFISNSVIANGSGHGFVLGYDGSNVDFRSNNEFESLAGCPATLPRDGACPNPRPSCM